MYFGRSRTWRRQVHVFSSSVLFPNKPPSPDAIFDTEFPFHPPDTYSFILLRSTNCCERLSSVQSRSNRSDKAIQKFISSSGFCPRGRVARIAASEFRRFVEHFEPTDSPLSGQSSSWHNATIVIVHIGSVQSPRRQSTSPRNELQRS